MREAKRFGLRSPRFGARGQTLLHLGPAVVVARRTRVDAAAEMRRAEIGEQLESKARELVNHIVGMCAEVGEDEVKEDEDGEGGVETSLAQFSAASKIHTCDRVRAVD